jgi:hypothetical protein
MKTVKKLENENVTLYPVLYTRRYVIERDFVKT